MNKRKFYVCLSGFCLFIVFLLILAHRYKLYAITIKERNSVCTCFSVMSFNVASIDSIDFPVSKQERLVSLIEKEKPDIVCFQELSFDNLRKIKPHLDSIYGSCDILKGDNQYWRLRFYSRFPLRQFSRHYCKGDINLESMNDKELSEISLFQKQMNLMSCEFEIRPNKWVKVYSGHLRSSAYSNVRLSMSKDDWWIAGMPNIGGIIRWENVCESMRQTTFEGSLTKHNLWGCRF